VTTTSDNGTLISQRSAPEHIGRQFWLVVHVHVHSPHNFVVARLQVASVIHSVSLAIVGVVLTICRVLVVPGRDRISCKYIAVS